MLSQIRSLRWVNTQTPTRRITPITAGYNEELLRLSVHIYVIRNDSLFERIKMLGTGDEDWKHHRVTLNYEGNRKQVFQFVYQDNDNRKQLNEVILSSIFTGEYSAQTDTVKIHYVPNGVPDDKYIEDEKRILNGG